MNEDKEYTKITVQRDAKIDCCVCNITRNLICGDIFFIIEDGEDRNKRICAECMEMIEKARKTNNYGTTSSSKTIAVEAAETVEENRKVYGSPFTAHCRIAELWNAYLNGFSKLEKLCILSPEDVALMMILLKIARLQESPDHRDSLVDIIGYAECYAEIMKIEIKGKD